MKSALTVVLFLLFTIGVCVDGKEESVSVTEGDSVTLKSGVTEKQTDDGIEWRFSGIRIAKISSDYSGISLWVKTDGSFKDRLQLDSQTGDLKISSISATDSGLYKVKISSPRGTSEMTFTVKVVSAVVPADKVKSVSVLEGDSVTLYTDPTYKHNVVQWRYGQQKSPVAEINRVAGIFNTSDGPEGRFRGRLELDHQTGSLTITNIRTTDSGLYEVEISSTSSRYTIHHTQSFSVTVRDAVQSVSGKEGSSVTLQIDVTEIQSNDLILWMFGDTVLAEINKAAQRFSTYDGPDKSFRDRLQLDNQTGSLTITNIRTTDSGLYEVKISSSRHTINRRITVTVIDAVKSLSVKKGETVTLQIDVTEIQNDDLIVWMFGDIGLAEMHKAAQQFNTSDGPDGRFRDRLQLDHQTGSLTITNTRTTDSGLYELKISRSRHIINRRFVVIVTGSDPVSGSGRSDPDSGSDPVSGSGRSDPDSGSDYSALHSGSGLISAWIFVGILVAAVIAGVIYHCWKISELKRQNKLPNNQTQISEHSVDGEERRKNLLQLSEDIENVSMKNLDGDEEERRENLLQL